MTLKRPPCASATAGITTEDMGFLDEEGFFWHEGRLKRFVKIGREMVSLVKVENILEQFLPGNISCCVVELPDPVKGAKIVAVVTQDVDEGSMLKKMGDIFPISHSPSSSW